MIQVSVILPVYNVDAYLRQCLDSIVHQTLSEIEIICVDDGSLDDSPRILSEYASKDRRIQIITQKNAGPGAARNTGLERANGEYVIFLDSDDWFELDFLEKMALRAIEAGADVTICQTVEFDTETGKERSADWMLKRQLLPGEVFSPEEVSQRVFQFTYGMPWDKLYHREFIDQAGIRFPQLKNSEDLAFVFPSILASRKIAIHPGICVHHRINRASSVSNNLDVQPDAPYLAFQIVKDWMERTGKLPFYRQSFLNWAMEFLIWHICNINDSQIQKAVHHQLRSVWFQELGFASYPRDYYFSKTLYAKYLLVQNAPYWVFRLVLKAYKSLFKKF